MSVTVPVMLIGAECGGPSLLNATTAPSLPLAGIVTVIGIADPDASVFDHSFRPPDVLIFRRYLV